jgi:hypothetical protein
MPQIGSENKSVVLKSGKRNNKRILGMTGSFYTGDSKKNYDDNWERIFGNKSEIEIARETSKTFSMEQS